jgi:hypothetical protein
MSDNENCLPPNKRTPWNKGKVIGARPPLRPKHVWSIRTRLLLGGRVRDLALFNLAIDSKLRGCDIVAVKKRRILTIEGIWNVAAFTPSLTLMVEPSVKARLYVRCGTPMSSTMMSRSRAGMTSRILSSTSLKMRSVASMRVAAGARTRARGALGRHKMLDPLIRRSKIFGVEIHSRFDTESIEIGRQPLVGPRAPHVVKMQ